MIHPLFPRQSFPPTRIAPPPDPTTSSTSTTTTTSPTTPPTTSNTSSSSSSSTTTTSPTTTTTTDTHTTTGGTTLTTTTSSGGSSNTTPTSPSTSSTTSNNSSPTSPSTGNTTSQTVVTVTSTQVTSSPSGVAASSSSLPSTSQGFFQNKAAVAGVFTVVGLIGLVILIALITNWIRRRRAADFDREIAEAAAEAAAARAPAFLDDENENYRPGYGGASAYGKYSDGSHGTYSQPPMSEAYNMRQMGPSPGDLYDSNVYNPSAAGPNAGAAGIGVARARSRRDGTFAAGLQEGTSPYPAFAGPQYNDGYNTSRSPPPPDFRGAGPSDSDVDPAVFGGAGVAVRRGFSQQTHQTGYSNMSRNRSVNGLSSDGHSSNASHVPLVLQPRVQRNPSVTQSSAPVPTFVDNPSASDPLPNPFSAKTETHHILEEQEDESEEEEEQPRRVLRVANE